MKFIKKILITCLILASTTAPAQTLGVKSNLLMDALLNINLGVEMPLSQQWTVDVTGEYNGWILSHQRRWKHGYLQPEVRYWFCNRWTGSFLGVHLFGGQYNLGALKNSIKFLGTDYSNLSDTRFQGWMVGAGIAYGYSWVLNRHWNLEAEIGLGYAYSRYDRFRCSGCNKKVESDKSHHYVGPTKAAINLVYLF
jgi:hypothetical protein